MSEGSRRRRRRWPWWLLLLALVAGGAVAVVRRGSAGSRDLDDSLIVEVKRGDLPIDVIDTGKVQPREKVEVKSKVAGQVERVFVEAGARVKRGQLLLRLDPTDFRRQVARCEADVAQARIALEYAQLNLERKSRGLANRAVAQAEVDFAANEVKAKRVAQQLAEVALGAAQDQLRYTQIASPIDGIVIERGIEPGEVVTPGVQATFEGKALLTVADLSSLIVKADLNQIDVAKVKLGQSVSLTLDAIPGASFTARVTRVAPASVLPKGKEIDVFPVEATLDGTDPRIKPGMTADVRVHVDLRKGVLSLPIEAVAKDGGKTWATRVLSPPGAGEKRKTDRVEVKVGARNDRDLEIASGLAAGDRVLIKPASSAENEFK
jgi:HlyD family secretion protein/macrolide-specific efflux system membrane fusion protein